jgi:hypothetical protein
MPIMCSAATLPVGRTVNAYDTEEDQVRKRIFYAILY